MKHREFFIQNGLLFKILFFFHIDGCFGILSFLILVDFFGQSNFFQSFGVFFSNIDSKGLMQYCGAQSDFV